MPQSSARLHYGFTLIELSIVLIIIALVIGGVVVSKEMINQSTVCNVVRQLDTYRTAAYAFRDKFQCLPGDCSFATRFWGQDNTANACYRAAVSAYSPLTCNGNGNGSVSSSVTNIVFVDWGYENLRFWQHL